MNQLNTRIFIGMCLLLIGFSNVVSAEPTNSAINDLSKLDFNHEGRIQLDSNWVFFWNELITPNNIPTGEVLQLNHSITSWTNLRVDNKSLPSYGYGSYFTQLVLPSNRPSLALKIPKIFSSAKIWINDKVVFEAGKVGKDTQSTLHRRKSIILPIESKLDTISIIVQVANYYHRNGGMTKPIILDKTFDLWDNDRRAVMSDMILIGSLMFIGFSFLILFYAYWNMDKAILYFSIFCLCWAYRNLSDNYAPLPFLFDNFSWVIHVKLEYISLFFGSLMGSLFLNSVFKDYFNVLYPRLNSWLVYTLIGLTIITPGYYHYYILPPFFALISVNIIYVIFELVQITKERLQPTLALVGITFGLLVLSIHIYTYNILNETNHTLINVGYLFVFMINSILLGKRFSVSFRNLKQMEAQTREENTEVFHYAGILNKQNEELEDKVAERTAELIKVVEDLKQRNINLEQFNYIISHNMRAPVANIAGLLSLYNHKNTNDPVNELALEKLDESCKQLDTVLKDLTTILEVKHKADRPNEEIVFEEFVSKILNSIRQEVEASNAEFQLNFEVRKINSIGSLWYSIFMNLISNAIKYRKDDTPCIIKIESKQYDDQTVITFEDNGLGMNVKEDGDEIFGLYKRFHNHVEGKGMGLFMVKTQIESMGGNISLESSPNNGAKFTLSILNMSNES